MISKMATSVNAKLDILVKNANFMMTSVHQTHAKTVQAVTLALETLQNARVLLDGPVIVAK